MGGKRDQGPSDLELALSGDEDALESVLGGIVAPLFDFALHLSAHRAEAAEITTLAALRAFAKTVREGALGHADPLTAAAREVLALDPEAPAKTTAANSFPTALAALAPGPRRAVVAAYALGADDAELAHVLGMPAATAKADKQAGVAALELSEDGVVAALDALAAEVPLPRGLIDRALGD